MAIQYAKCCRPIPGDEVIGQFRKGQGLLVHTRDCVTLKKQRVAARRRTSSEAITKITSLIPATMVTVLRETATLGPPGLVEVGAVLERDVGPIGYLRVGQAEAPGTVPGLAVLRPVGRGVGPGFCLALKFIVWATRPLSKIWPRFLEYLA